MEITNFILAIVAIVFSILGIIYSSAIMRETRSLFKRMESILTSEMDIKKYKTLVRLVEDAEKTGSKSGRLTQNKNGEWIINWELEITDTIKVSDKNKSNL